MAKTYVTFGQSHAHTINGKTLNKDTVAVIDCVDMADGRKRAFEYFDSKFCFSYFEDEFNHDTMVYFPLGFVEV